MDDSPAAQVARAMARMYRNRMCTPSGGNVSMLDASGDIWLTPSGRDKGALAAADICRVSPCGKTEGPFAPSVELAFHREVYRVRPDIRAVLHAHPPHIVAFSLAGRLPCAGILPHFRETLGPVRMAAYALPGSARLGRLIAGEFEKGAGIVLMESHGVAVGAASLEEACAKAEALERCAEIETLAAMLGGARKAGGNPFADDTRDFCRGGDSCSDFDSERAAMLAYIRRALRQGLFVGGDGSLSVRLAGGCFLVTPRAGDLESVSGSGLVKISGRECEAGKRPCRFAGLHRGIYDRHPGVNSVFAANPPHISAFAVTDAPFLARTIPESYIALRGAKKVPAHGGFPALASRGAPLIICENGPVLAIGSCIRQAFDRLEVAEATARAALLAGPGAPVLGESQLEEIDRAFGFA